MCIPLFVTNIKCKQISIATSRARKSSLSLGSSDNGGTDSDCVTVSSLLGKSPSISAVCSLDPTFFHLFFCFFFFCLATHTNTYCHHLNFSHRFVFYGYILQSMVAHQHLLFVLLLILYLPLIQSQVSLFFFNLFVLTRG